MVRYRVYADGSAERHERLHGMGWDRYPIELTEEQQRKFAVLKLAAMGMPQNVANFIEVRGVGEVHWVTRDTTIVSFYGEE